MLPKFLTTKSTTAAASAFDHLPLAALKSERRRTNAGQQPGNTAPPSRALSLQEFQNQVIEFFQQVDMVAPVREYLEF